MVDLIMKHCDNHDTLRANKLEPDDTFEMNEEEEKVQVEDLKFG